MKKPKENTLSFTQNVNLLLRGLKLFMSFPAPIFLAKTVSNVCSAIVPFINIYFSAQIINELSGAKDQNKLVSLVLLTIGLNLLGVLIKSAANRWEAHCNSTTWTSMYKVYTDKMLSMDYIDIENPEMQEQFSQIRQNLNGMGFGLPRLIQAYDGVITGVIQIIVSVAMAFSLFTLKVPTGSSYAFLDSPLAMVILLIILSGSVLLAPYLSMVGDRIWSKANQDNNRGNRVFSFYFFQMISGSNRAKDIRLYDQKRLIDKGISWWDQNNGGYGIIYAKYNAKFAALSTGVSYLSNGFIYLFVALKAFAGAFGIGGIVQYVGAITQFGSGFASVLTQMGKLMNNNVILEQSFKFLDIPNKKYLGSLSVEKRDDNEYEIEFRNVSFKYPGSETYALKNLNFKLMIGQRIAVVGMNGSGKTTMIKLLCRLYDPTEGIITLNGIDIKKYNYDEYMSIFSVVFQDFQLLPFPLGQNVAAGVTYDANKVAQTLQKAGFQTRLDAMPKGIDTYLYKNFEEEGVEVSGGEAQKIALSRALYKDAPFIVLDEPTAALDPIAESEIYAKFNDIVGDKTAIYISHRLSSCRFCSDIAVFHEGQMIQRGAHEDLVANQNGKYYELWNAQAQYYAEDSSKSA